MPEVSTFNTFHRRLLSPSRCVVPLCGSVFEGSYDRATDSWRRYLVSCRPCRGAPHITQ